MRSTFFYFLMIICVSCFAQTQTLRGTVRDNETQFPLIGATVVVLSVDSGIEKGTAADLNGDYAIYDLPYGKYTVNVSFLGYKNQNIPNVTVGAGKETILILDLEENAVKLNEVVISSSRKDETNNDMATVSARTFNVEETSRYAGSRSDPVRMASNFAGAQGSDDSRNDIVIRGNTPTGVLWRVEDIDIPNPNHFAIAGTNGGPISILNNKMLRKSDFFTGAFPAEYGNATAGAFDLKFRNGNNKKHEFTGQFGLLGSEITAEGPLGGDSTRASYLVNARYSTFALFGALNVDIGTTAIPQYWDGAFKLNFPLKNNANLSLFGMGGKSSIDIIVSDLVERPEELYGQTDRDQLFRTGMGVTGMNYKKSINKKLLFKFSAAATGNQSRSRHIKAERDLAYNLLDTFLIRSYNVQEERLIGNASLTYKWNAKNTLKSGVGYIHYFYDMYDFDFDSAGNRFQSIDFFDRAGLLRVYSQWKYKASNKLSFNVGVNGQLYTLNGSTAIEPRAGLRYKINNKNTLSLGYGKHSQIQPNYFYFQEFADKDGNIGQHNRDLDFSRSDHFVIGYDWAINQKSRLKVETYYQNLYNIPIYADTATAFSMVNFGSSYRFIYPPELENTGTGYNYGIEFTYERFFNKSFFLLSTLSLYDSKYKGSDGIERVTAFNGNYAANLLGGKEWTFGKEKQKTLGVGGNITYAGGRRYTPADTAASFAAEEFIEDMALTNSGQFKDYFRFDFKISYKVNMKKVAHTIAIDVANVLGTENVLRREYLPPTETTAAGFVNVPQLGRFPVFKYQIDF